MSNFVRTKTLKAEAIKYQLAAFASAFAMAASIGGAIYQVGNVTESYQRLSALKEAELNSLQSIDADAKQQIEMRPTYEWLKLAGSSGAALVLAGATLGFGVGSARRYDALRMRGM